MIMALSDELNPKKTLTEISRDDEEEFEKIVSKYPSSFHLEICCLTKSYIKDTRNKLLMKCQSDFIFLEEKLRLYNLISYLSALLDDYEAAFDFNSKVLSENRKNGIALANRARLNRYSGNFYDSKQDIEKLQKLYDSDDADLVTAVLAKCELAWSYARFGPKYHQQTISMLEAISGDMSQLDADQYYLWTYEYGICLKRTLHLENRVEYPDVNDVTTITKACKVFVDIAKHAPSKTYKARAWAHLGSLAFTIENRPITFGLDIQKYISVHRSNRSSKAYFRVARYFDDSDFEVLELSAKYYRYFGKPEKAIKLFDRALELGKSSLAYHHLALSRKKVEHDRQQGCNLHKKNMSRDYYLEEESNIRKLINSPRRAPFLYKNKETEAVLQLFNKAVEIDSGNHCAMKDKAFTYRQLRRSNTAREMFCRLANSLDNCEMKVTCYEQAGYCCLDLAEDHNGSQLRYEHDAICNLKKAIEIAAALAAKVQYSSLAVRQILPTVSDMLINPSLLEAHNSELERLKVLLEKNGSYLSIVNEARSAIARDINALRDRCINEDRLDDAGFLVLLEEALDKKNDEAFIQDMKVFLLTASTSLARADHETSMHWYQIFFDNWAHRRYGEDKQFDVFLMTDEEPENLTALIFLSKWLQQYCGLYVVSSFDVCRPGQPFLSTLMGFCEASALVCLVQKRNEVDRRMEILIESVLLNPDFKTKLVILKDKSVKLPNVWVKFPVVTLPDEEKNDDMSVSSWLADVFGVLLAT